MSFSHILVPYDKSETAARALDQAVEIAEKSGAGISILYVTSMPDITTPITYASSNSSTELYSSDPALLNVEEVVRQRKSALAAEQAALYEELRPRFDAIADRVDLTIQPGITPVDDIVEFAGEHSCDLIVMGCRGLGAIRGMLGSVSYGVLRASSCPVLIVK